MRAPRTLGTESLPFGKKAPFPGFVEPMLAKLVSAPPPEGGGWVHEIKLDGYRLQAHLRNRRARLFTRSGLDWTEKFPAIARDVEALPVESCILDGEAVVVDDDGRSDFQRLQGALDETRGGSILFYAFDLLYLDGFDLRELPLTERKAALEVALAKTESETLLLSHHLEAPGEAFLASACKASLEGMVSKLASSPYRSGRGGSWVKAKCGRRQELVIGGFTDPAGSRAGFGSLLLGAYEGGKLRYCGRVGTGFDRATLRTLRARLKRLERAASPFGVLSPRGRGLHWVKPELVAEVSFAEWTNDGLLRAPVFRGLRRDKPAREVLREVPDRAPPAADPFAGVSHPERELFPRFTKLDLARYYHRVADRMVPHLRTRPLSLVRCPEGMAGDCFFQKHLPADAPDTIDRIPVRARDEVRSFVGVSSAEGLVALVQRGTLELHAQNVRDSDLHRPDQLVMDFDPGPGVPWKRVVEAAFRLKALLDGLGLESFVKTTGGKGLHVHVPFEPRYEVSRVKAFALTLAREMAENEPSLFTTSISKKLRHGKIFVDYLRNGEGATAVAPYSVRAREGAPVAWPVSWRQLPRIRSGSEFTVFDVAELLRRRDPWAGYFQVSQRIALLEGLAGAA